MATGSAFTARPPISAHVRSTRYVPRCGEPGLVHLCCAVCGVIGAASPFHPTDGPAAALMAAHVALVASLADLPDRPEICLACRPPSGRSGSEPWALCRRHVCSALVTGVRTAWASGDAERLLRAWWAFEDEFGWEEAPGDDTPSVAATEFGSDLRALDAALDGARMAWPDICAARERRDRAACERAAENRRRDSGCTCGRHDCDQCNLLPESQSTTWGTNG